MHDKRGKLNQSLHIVGHALSLKFYCLATHKHISILFYTYLTAPISKYLNTSPYSSLTKSFLLESNLYNFSSSYNLIFSLSLTSIFLILHISYILQILYPTKHLCLYHLHTSQEMPNTHTKALLMEGLNFYY